jgi:Domain of unknown function (DUF4114)
MPHALARIAAATTLSLAALAAHAGPIPYPSAGVENTTLYTFTAASTGVIGAYFFSGGAASYENELTMLVNGVATGIQGLNNQSSAYGAYLDLGTVTAGDVIVFKMVNIAPGGVGPWYSDKSLNSDGINHIYSTDYAGDGSTVPGGTYVAFEDLTGGGDFNYNDLSFVFTNISTSTGVPVPATPALLLAAGLAAAALRRRAH